MKTKKIDLMMSIAGSDNTCGAGVQADIKTCQSLQSYCLNCLTAVTSQNSEKVFKILELPSNIIQSQILTLISEYELDSIKIGLVKSVNQAKTIVKVLKKNKISVPIVVDPIYKSTTNTIFNKKSDYQEIYKILSKLKPVFTPNLYELKILLDLKKIDDIDIMIMNFYKKFKCPIVLTNAGNKEEKCEDFFLNDEKEIERVSSNKISSRNTHGSGCSFSSALAVYLGRGFSIAESICSSKKLINKYITQAPDFDLKYGPMGHWLIS